MSKTFCILPWIHLASNASGNYRLCCNSKAGVNLIRDDNNKPYHLKSSNVDDVWNSPTYRTIRQQMLNGEEPTACERCFREEQVGVRSARMSFNEMFEHHTNKVLEHGNKSASASDFVRYVDLRLGNLCNLKCRMCNPYASNQWIDEWDSIEPALDEMEILRLSNMTWPSDGQVWENLKPIVPTVEEIYLVGGEPTIIAEQHKLLSYCIEQGYANNITLKYNTNVTNIPNNLLDVWSHFKKVRVNCSIDAVGDLNRYIRYPSNWKAIDKNLKRLYDLSYTSNIVVGVHTTVQIMNILHLDHLFDYLKQFNTFPYLNILNHPEYLNIRVLPDAFKQQATNALNQYMTENSQWLQGITGTHWKKIPSVIEYMNSDNWGDKLPAFIQYTKTLDKSRNQSILSVLPEFKDLLNG